MRSAEKSLNNGDAQYSKLPLIVIVAPLKLNSELAKWGRDSKYVVFRDPYIIKAYVSCAVR